MPSLSRRLAVCALLLLAMFWAAAAGYAQLQTRWLEQEVIAAEVAARRGDDVAVQLSGAGLPLPPAQAASALQHELQARAGQLLAGATVPQKERNQRLRDARMQLRAAATLRPSWPYVWAELAALKAKEGVFDTEFVSAFRRALKLGPNEPRVQQQLLGIVLRYPERLDDSLAVETGEIIGLSARHHAGRLFELASRYHRAAWLCASPNLDADVARLCVQRGFK